LTNSFLQQQQQQKHHRRREAQQPVWRVPPTFEIVQSADPAVLNLSTEAKEPMAMTARRTNTLDIMLGRVAREKEVASFLLSSNLLNTTTRSTDSDCPKTSGFY
jgi:hypothetical protein